MNETLSWDDLRLFLAVARAGGLSAAAAQTALSPPTLGRRITSLERRLGMPLFDRHRSGYDLTAVGREILEHAEAFERQALALERWRATRDPRPLVRIAAGDWTSRFLAQHADELVQDAEGLRLEILTGTTVTDLNRREANLGIRNRRPDTPGLAGQRLGQVEFAVFASRHVAEDTPAVLDERRYSLPNWIALKTTASQAPSADWLERQLQRAPALRCSSPRNLLDAARAGAGLCVLPCFIGDPEQTLARVSSSIAELSHEQWLVSQDDDRKEKAIRSVSRRLVSLFRQNRDLFAGARGMPGTCP